METGSSSKRKKLSNISNHDHDHEDRISNLPEPVLHLILHQLPIRSIARTSILSKRRRQLWYSYPDLDFTTLDYPHGRKRLHPESSKGAELIDHVLNQRDHKLFSIRILKFRACLSFSRLNGLIRRAIKCNVQELDIEVTTDDYFNFPRCVIISESLRVFRLKSRYPGFRIPPPVLLNGGFPSLVSLSLSRVILYDQPSLVNLFSGPKSFPRLKKLCLENCFGLKHLNVNCRSLLDLILENCFQLEYLDISCLKLESLRIVGCFDAYSSNSWFKLDTPLLKRMFWSYNTIAEAIAIWNLVSLVDSFVGFFALHEDLSSAKLRSVSNFLSGLSHSQTITLENSCIEILSKNYHFEGIFQYPFSKLKSMELRTGFNKRNLHGLATLFRNSPNVHTLVIKIDNVRKAERRKWNKDLWQSSSSGEERFWESQSRDMNSFLHHLKLVKIQGFSECESDVSLVKFLLKHGKVLQQIFLSTRLSYPRKLLERDKIKSQIRGFSRASSNAKIYFL